MYLYGVAIFVRNPQIGHKAAQKISRASMILKQKHGFRRGVDSLRELKQQRGLSHARPGNHSHEPAPACNAAEQRRHRLAVGAALEEVARVGSDPEWLFAKFVIVQKH